MAAPASGIGSTSTTPAPAAQAQSGGSQEQQSQEQQGSEGAETSDSEFERLMQEFAPRPAQNQDDDAELNEPLDGVSERAQKRFRTLAGSNKELRGQLAELNKQVNAYSQWSHGAYQAFQQQNAQLQALQAQLSGLAQNGAQQRMPEPEPTDEVGKFKKMLEQELLGKADSRFTPQLQQMYEVVQSLQKSIEEDKRRQESRQRAQTYSQQTERALAEIVKPLMADDVYDQIRQPLGGIALSMAMSRPDADVNAAAAQLANILKMAVHGVLKSHSKRNGRKVAESNNAPAHVESSRAGAVQSPVPTLKDLRAAGYTDHLDWQFRGSPPIPKKR